MIREHASKPRSRAIPSAAPNGSQEQTCAGVEPAFLRISPSQIGRVVARSSPHYQEGQWTAREYALLAAVVAFWFTELQQLAREQLKSKGALWLSPDASKMLRRERRGVEAVAAWLGLEPVWIDRMLQSLDLVFPPAACVPDRESQAA